MVLIWGQVHKLRIVCLAGYLQVDKTYKDILLALHGSFITWATQRLLLNKQKYNNDYVASQNATWLCYHWQNWDDALILATIANDDFNMTNTITWTDWFVNQKTYKIRNKFYFIHKTAECPSKYGSFVSKSLLILWLSISFRVNSQLTRLWLQNQYLYKIRREFSLKD